MMDLSDEDTAFLAELPADGAWRLTSEAGQRVATDASGKYAPVYRNPKGQVSSRTQHGLQPVRSA